MRKTRHVDLVQRIVIEVRSVDRDDTSCEFVLGLRVRDGYRNQRRQRDDPMVKCRLLFPIRLEPKKKRMMIWRGLQVRLLLLLLSCCYCCWSRRDFVHADDAAVEFVSSRSWNVPRPRLADFVVHRGIVILSFRCCCCGIFSPSCVYFYFSWLCG